MRFKLFSNNFNLLALLSLGLLSFLGALVYLVYALNWIGALLALALTVIALVFIIRYFRLTKQVSASDDSRVEINKLWVYGLFLLYGLLVFLMMKELIDARTSQPLISPWEVVKVNFFWAYGLGTLVLLFLALKKRLPLLLVMIHYFLTFGVAAIVYQIGFGYDPFIHRASLSVLDQLGYIIPKTVYYSGQYALEIIIHKLFFIPLIWIDKFLVPVLAAIFLPLTLNWVLQSKYGTSVARSLLPLLLLAFPSSLFIVTVPQNLAYLFLLLAIIISFGRLDRWRLLLISILALAALMAHPLAGIPALALAALCWLKASNFSKSVKTGFRILIYSGAALALPIIFLFLGNNHLTGFREGALRFGFSVPGQENLFLNFIYLLANNGHWIIIILLLLTGRVILKSKQLQLYYFLCVTLLISYGLSRQIVFSDLATNNQNDYPLRVLISGLLFLLPLILVVIYQFLERIKQRKLSLRISLVVLATLLVTVSLYLSYPRLDNYHNSRGYSVSGYDIETVRLINGLGGEGDYIVLANQQVGAAAVQEFGLKKYYQENIFYYSAQTGSQLYDYYLQMINEPQRETMNQALDFVGVSHGFLVVNKYWWAAKKIIEAAKLEADNYYVVSEGEEYIFEYFR